MDIDPVIPPIDGFRFERKAAAFLFRKRCGKQTGVFAFEHVFVVQNERLVKFNQFIGAIQIAFGFGERRFFEAKFFRERLMPLTTAFCMGMDKRS